MGRSQVLIYILWLIVRNILLLFKMVMGLHLGMRCRECVYTCGWVKSEQGQEWNCDELGKLLMPFYYIMEIPSMLNLCMFSSFLEASTLV
jgi:hypothetical protein